MLPGESRKKLLFVITKSNWGGAQSYVFQLAEWATRVGFDVTVAMGGTGKVHSSMGLLAERLHEGGIKLSYISALSRDISSLQEFRALFSLVKLMRATRPNIIHLNSSKAGFVGALAGRVAGIPKIIFTAHGWPHREPRNSIAKAALWIVSWLTVALCTRVITVSRFDGKDAPAIFFRKKIYVVPNGVPRFKPLNKFAARDELSCLTAAPTDGLWFITTAELHPNKGIDISIRAFATIAAEFPSVHYMVLGEGQSRSELELLISQLNMTARISLAGFIPNSNRYLSAADIFVLTSRKEGLPLSILEAGIASVPCIVSSVGGIPEIVSDNSLGIVVPPNDVHATSAAMRKMLWDNDLVKSCGAHLSTKVETEFSHEKMLQAVRTLYDEN